LTVLVKLRIVPLSSRQSAGYVVVFPAFIKFQGAGDDKNTLKLCCLLINSRFQ